MPSHFSVIIVGGGLVGLTAAKALADQAISVTLVESKPPSLDWPAASRTAQVCALNQASAHILNNLNAWDAIPLPAKTPLYHMDVWDHQHHGELRFSAMNIPAPRLGYIVENRAIVKALWLSLQDHPHVTLQCPATPQRLSHHGPLTQLTLMDGTVLEAHLVIGADGPHSWVRQASHFSVYQRPYHHDAITMVIQTEEPHQHTALQQFLPKGPIGILPLHHSHQSSIVWSTTPTHVDTLLALPQGTLNQSIAEALDHRWGTVNTVTQPIRFPLHMRHANAVSHQQRGLNR